MMTRDGNVQAQLLLEDFLAFQAPPGYRAELVSGEIVVSPPPGGNHNRILDEVLFQMHQRSAVRMQFSGTSGLDIPPPAGEQGGERYIPDGLFAPRELDILKDAPSWMAPAGIALVLQVTSSRPGRGREAKRLGYARAGIPLYLLVDRDRAAVTLFARPAGGDYRRGAIEPFGAGMDLPAPFAFTLETGTFTS